MNRSKIIAISTGVLSVLLAIGYLLLVQILDFRGNLEPAPLDLGFLSPIAVFPPLGLSLLVSSLP
ncbi:hypothetical protein [Prochlorothrix hollandica]|uniref:Glucose-inhibited division protein A n=1 Tax=Prochlorothrix hollandica PCC 9006 = CALU 1027 TaxID=317619 RepID=A0A0M2Q203_PROHO|nr:hypothetical protein [Prochlorothrix hollandica]KKJ00999.1 hypothetical protein PROH_00755 [Prochlorothrix hollandica PCC 9006 = CALU 1027]